MKNEIQLIRNNFDRAAISYALNAQIQRDPAIKLLEMLYKYSCDINYNDEFILDLGSGIGTLQHAKSANYDNFIAFDLSGVMLRNSQYKHRVNGDAGNLPFADNSFSVVISNLMIQWSSDKTKVFNEINRIIAVGGKLIFTTLIAPSLYELQQSWRCVDDNPHTLEFLSQNKYVELLENCGFNILENISWCTTIHFKNLGDLLQHFKLTGTNLAKSNSNIGLGGKLKLKALNNAYELLTTESGLPLTYVYLLIVASKE